MKKLFALILCSVVMLSGCNAFVHETVAPSSGYQPEDYDAEGIPYFTEVEHLESGHYYIYRNGRYYSPVFYDASFDTSERNSSSSKSKTAWFTEEQYKHIPTLYDTDALVFFYSTSFSEKFTFERFKYNGYTVGICNLKKTSTGRYSFNAVADNKNIDANSDAGRLLSLQTNDVIIESIGKSELRSGNISESGTIVGLQKDQFYRTELYIGSVLQVYTLKADVVALSSLASYSTSDYAFLQSTIAKVNIPDYFVSGYYSINGIGIFRYLKGTRDPAAAEDNLPITVKDSGKKQYDQQELIADGASEKQIPFVVQKEAKVTVLVEYENEPGLEYNIAPPDVRLICKDRIRVVSERGDGVITESFYLSTGKYVLSISGMSGRAYKYIVTADVSEE